MFVYRFFWDTLYKCISTKHLGKILIWTKYFVGQNFHHLQKISSLLSDIFLFDKVSELVRYIVTLKGGFTHGKILFDIWKVTIKARFHSTVRTLRPERLFYNFSIAQYYDRRLTKCIRLVVESDSTLERDILVAPIRFVINIDKLHFPGIERLS